MSVAQRPIRLPDPPLADGVVALRTWQAADAEPVTAAIADAELGRFTNIPRDQPVEVTREWLLDRERVAATGAGASYAVVDARTGDLLGSIGIQRSLDDPGCAEIGYWVAREARGRGVATRALVLLSRWAFRELELARIQLTVHEENAASRRVAEKAGFRREGLLRAVREQHGRRVDLLMYSLLPGDVQAER